MTDLRSPVEDHYTRPDLGEVILAALRAAGKDLDRSDPGRSRAGRRVPSRAAPGNRSGWPSSPALPGPSGCSMSAPASAGRRGFSPAGTDAASPASI